MDKGQGTREAEKDEERSTRADDKNAYPQMNLLKPGSKQPNQGSETREDEEEEESEE